MAKYLNQAPKDFDSQSVKFKALYPGGQDTLVADGYILQPKYDGCHLIIDTQAGVAYSRTGEAVRSVDHLVKQAQLAFGLDVVVFGEAWRQAQPFRVISGQFRRHNPEPTLKFVAFDIIPLEAYLEGECTIPYEERLGHLLGALVAAPQPDIILASTAPLWALPGAYAAMLKSDGGYDGAILRDPRAGWKPGAAKQGEVIKVKPVNSLDLLCTGWFMGNGKHADRAGGITVDYKGVTSQVGTGFSDDEREAIKVGGVEGCIAEVEFMELTADGKLREPRFKGWRNDKYKPD